MSLKRHIAQAGGLATGVALPGLIIALALWQAHRASTTLDLYAQFAPSVVAATNAAIVCPVRIYLSILACASGTVAILAYITGLIAAWYAGQRGLRTRSDLLAAFTGVVRILPSLLSLQVASIAVAIAAAGASDMLAILISVQIGPGVLKLEFLLGAAAIGALNLGFVAVRRLRAVISQVSPEDRLVLAHQIMPKDAPGLWALVERLSIGEKAAAPTAIVLGVAPQTYVTSFPMLVMPAKQRIEGRILHLSLPLLAVLSEAELTAVVAHELAHFAGEDTVYSQRFLPAYAVMQHALAAVDGGGTPLQRLQLRPAARLAATMLGRFHAAVLKWSRLRELEADAAMVAATDPQTAATALLRHTLASHALNQALGSMSAMVAGTVLTDFVSTTASALVAMSPEMLAAHLQERQAHPYDTHPPTATRLAAMGVVPDAAFAACAKRPMLREDMERVAGLFADWPRIQKTVLMPVIEQARLRHAARHAAMSQIAAGASLQDFVVQERLWIVAAKWIAIALCLFAIGAFVGFVGLRAFADSNPNSFVPLLISLPMLAGGTAIFWWIAQVLLARRPFLVLSKDALLITGLAPIPWADINQLQAQCASRDGVPLQLTIVLTAQAVWPTRKRLARVAFQPKRRVIRLKSLYPVAPRGQAFSEMIAEYCRGAAARRFLATTTPPPPEEDVVKPL